MNLLNKTPEPHAPLNPLNLYSPRAVECPDEGGVMRRYVGAIAMMALLGAGCGASVNVEQERSALLAVDREWSQTTKDTDKFLSYFAPDASAYPPGMPIATGTA